MTYARNCYDGALTAPLSLVVFIVLLEGVGWLTFGEVFHVKHFFLSILIMRIFTMFPTIALYKAYFNGFKYIMCDIFD